MHRDVDAVAAAGRLAAEQRHQHGGEPLQRAQLIGDRNGRDHRLAVVAERHAERAAHRLEREVVRRTVTIGALMPERADRAVDEARIARAQRVVARDRDGRRRRDGRSRRTRRRCRTASSSRSRCAASLRSSTTLFLPRLKLRKNTVAGPSDEPDVAAGIAFARRLDLDHLGAVVGERHRQIRPRQERRQIDDAQAGELHAALTRRRALRRTEHRLVVGAERGRCGLLAGARRRS